MRSGPARACSATPRPSRPWPRPVVRLADDPDPQVRFQLALSLAQWNDPRAGQRPGPDRPPRPRPIPGSARPCSARPRPTLVPLLTALFDGRRDEPPPAAIVEPLFALAGSRRRIAEGCAPLVQRARARPPGRGVGSRPGSSRRWPGWLDAAARARRPIAPEDDRRLDGLSTPARAAGRRRQGRATTTGSRRSACSAATRDTRDDDRDVLAATAPAAGLRRVAAGGRRRAGAERRPARSPELLLAGWKGHSPQLRAVVLDALLSRAAWTVGAALVAGGHLHAPRRDRPGAPQRLLDHRDPNVRERAEAVFDQRDRHPAGGPRRLPPGPGTARRSGRRRGGLQEGLRDLPPPGRRGHRGRSRPRRADRQVARVAPGRDPRPEPGVRGEVHQLQRLARRRPRPDRPDRHRDRHRR